MSVRVIFGNFIDNHVNTTVMCSARREIKISR